MPHYHIRRQRDMRLYVYIHRTTDFARRGDAQKATPLSSQKIKEREEFAGEYIYTHFVGDGDGRVVVDGGHDQFVDQLEGLFGRLLLLGVGGRRGHGHRRPVVGRRQRGRHRGQHQGGHGCEHPTAVGAVVLLLLRLLVVQLLLLLEVVERRLEDIGGQSGCCCCWAHWVIHFADEGSRVG
jgi:hypothetical protein